jgi:hypothetical protein
MIDLEKLDFEYFPYPIGFAKDPIEGGYYKQLSESFPPLELFKDIAVGREQLRQDAELPLGESAVEGILRLSR